jgi:hypothetical protein
MENQKIQKELFDEEEINKDLKYYFQSIFGYFCLFIVCLITIVFFVITLVKDEIIRLEIVQKRLGLVQ